MERAIETAWLYSFDVVRRGPLDCKLVRRPGRPLLLVKSRAQNQRNGTVCQLQVVSSFQDFFRDPRIDIFAILVFAFQLGQTTAESRISASVVWRFRRHPTVRWSQGYVYLSLSSFQRHYNYSIIPLCICTFLFISCRDPKIDTKLMSLVPLVLRTMASSTSP